MPHFIIMKEDPNLDVWNRFEEDVAFTIRCTNSAVLIVSLNSHNQLAFK